MVGIEGTRGRERKRKRRANHGCPGDSTLMQTTIGTRLQHTHHDHNSSHNHNHYHNHYHCHNCRGVPSTHPTSGSHAEHAPRAPSQAVQA